MMRMQIEPVQLFCEFCFDDHVPADHLLRRIYLFSISRACARSSGRSTAPSAAPRSIPELMMRMLIVGYRMGIRSERRLCEDVHLNLAYRLFCRLGLDGEVPDHST